MNQLVDEINEIIPNSSLVGGCVRDYILGLEPHDFDFCTSYKPDKIESLVKSAGKRAYVTGRRYGTIGFRHDGKFIEVTTYRSEVYEKKRQPKVEFIDDLEGDLSRRDFTMNAIAYNGKKYIDPFGGMADIKARTIRAVGNPTHRFKEDPLRMLRAVRFLAQLNFEIEEKTYKSIKKNANSILRISKERWMQELDKILMSDNVANGLRALADSGLLKFVLPELALQVGYDQNSDYHSLTLFEHTIGVVEKTEKNRILRWSALLHDIGKSFTRSENSKGKSNYVFHDVVGAELVYGIAKRLKWSNEMSKEVELLVRYHLKDESPLREADNNSK